MLVIVTSDSAVRNRYSENTFMWSHWIGSTIQIRPEVRFDRASDRNAYDNGTNKTNSP